MVEPEMPNNWNLRNQIKSELKIIKMFSNTQSYLYILKTNVIFH